MPEYSNGSDSEYFLHSRYGEPGKTESFHFRLKATPRTVLESFTITYAWDGCCIMHGDYGPLMWRRSYYDGPEYGFPGPKIGIAYFAEKCRISNHAQQIMEWNIDQAIEELKNYFADTEEEDPGYYGEVKVKELIEERAPWWDDVSPEVGRYKMYEDLNELFPDSEWYEHDFGMVYTDHFKYNFEKLKSVHHLVMNAVKQDKQEDSSLNWEEIMPCRYSPLGYSITDCSHWKSDSLICNGIGKCMICGHYHKLEEAASNVS